MTDSKQMRTAILWSLAALVSPFVVLILFLMQTPGYWNYRIGIALAEIAGVACLSRLPCALWIRVLCIAIYVPVGALIFFFFLVTMIFRRPM